MGQHLGYFSLVLLGVTAMPHVKLDAASQLGRLNPELLQPIRVWPLPNFRLLSAGIDDLLDQCLVGSNQISKLIAR
jgi:hypothetical protein